MAFCTSTQNFRFAFGMARSRTLIINERYYAQENIIWYPNTNLLTLIGFSNWRRTFCHSERSCECLRRKFHLGHWRDWSPTWSYAVHNFSTVFHRRVFRKRLDNLWCLCHSMNDFEHTPGGFVAQGRVPPQHGCENVDSVDSSTTWSSWWHIFKIVACGNTWGGLKDVLGPPQVFPCDMTCVVSSPFEWARKRDSLW